MMKNADGFQFVQIPDDLDMHMYFKLLEMIIDKMKKKKKDILLQDKFEMDVKTNHF